MLKLFPCAERVGRPLKAFILVISTSMIFSWSHILHDTLPLLFPNALVNSNINTYLKGDSRTD
jgi:hypothetical protein